MNEALNISITLPHHIWLNLKKQAVVQSNYSSNDEK
jgi:hypothetical protein